MNKLLELNNKFSLFTILRNLLENDLFKVFSSFCMENGIIEKNKLYTKFVSIIYSNGADLAKYVSKLLFENENIYVKLIAKNEKIIDEINEAMIFEIDTLNEFIKIDPSLFKEELNILGYFPKYVSSNIDLKKEYMNRISNVSLYGYGIYATNAMFQISDKGEIIPVISADKINFNNFIGYTNERKQVVKNTISFLENKPSQNVLLYGDAGTGKSSTVKAIVNEYFKLGLRLIEIRKNQLHLLSNIMGQISEYPLKFIIFIDDLSLNSNDDNFSMLKAMLEGSASSIANNALLYATSNRRHIVKETFDERENDIHRNDTIQESISLSSRFGLTILFQKPDKVLYLEIVNTLAKRNNLNIDKNELEIKAEAFALKKGYRSARCAEQFIKSIM